MRPTRRLLLPFFAVAAATIAPALRAPAHAAASPPSASIAGAQAALGSLPLAFYPAAEAPSASTVRFESHGGSGRVQLGDDSVVLRLGSSAETVRVKFDAAQPRQVVGAEPLRARINVLQGDDPARWRQGLPTFRAVDYRELFPGIDLRYEGEGGGLKGTYSVAPGADASAIRWRYEGVAAAHVDAPSGDLVLALGSGLTLREAAPVAWQDIAGRRRPVDVRYVLDHGAPPVRVRFTIGAYDGSLPLVIDPTLAWSTYIGGSGVESFGSVAFDDVGSVYVTGTTSSDDFPTTDGSSGPNIGIFVAKLDPFALPPNQLVYATVVAGGPLSFPRVAGLAVDSAGRAYVMGDTAGAAPTPNGFQSCALTSNVRAYFFRLDASGAMTYGTCLRGNGDSFGEAIALDTSNRVYLAGSTKATDFPTKSPAGAGPFQDANAGNADAFVAKIDPSLSGNASLVYSTYLGGQGTDEAHGIAVDPSNRAYVTGVTGSTQFPVSGGAFDTTISGGNDAFVTKIDGVGSTIFYSTFLGGSDLEEGRGIAVDGSGNAYVTGFTDSTDFPLRPLGGALQGNSNGTDAFVAKVGASGTSLVYSTYLGGAGVHDFGRAIAVANGSAYVAGFTNSTNFPAVRSLQTCGGSDAFMARLSPSGRRLWLSSCLGGSSEDHGNGVAVVPGALVLTGTTSSPDLPIENGYDTTFSGIQDTFVAMVEEPLLFLDGFELGSTAEWAAKSP